MGIEDDAFDLKARRAKIEQYAQPETGGFQVVDDLGLFVAAYRGDRLQLHEDVAKTNEIGAVGAGKRLPFIAPALYSACPL